MKTVVIGNNKGGVGKTAVAVHLAQFYAEQGKKTALIDFDNQGNASFTLEQYSSDLSCDAIFDGSFEFSLEDDQNLYLVKSSNGLVDLQRREPDELVPNMQAALEKLRAAGIEVVIIDTAPSLSTALVLALSCADALLSPIEVEMYSIQGIEKMILLFNNIKKFNKKIKFLGMLPSMYDPRLQRQKENLRDLKAAYPGLICDLKIGLRSSIAQSAAEGIPVWKIQKTAAREAAKEMRAVAKYVYNEVLEN